VAVEGMQDDKMENREILKKYNHLSVVLLVSS
jgi:hypothetical protein